MKVNRIEHIYIYVGMRRKAPLPFLKRTCEIHAFVFSPSAGFSLYTLASGKIRFHNGSLWLGS